MGQKEHIEGFGDDTARTARAVSSHIAALGGLAALGDVHALPSAPSLLDQFALAALPAMLARFLDDNTHGSLSLGRTLILDGEEWDRVMDNMAECAWDVAERMMTERAARARRMEKLA